MEGGGLFTSGKAYGGVVREDIDPSIVGLQSRLIGVLTVVGPPYCVVLVTMDVDGCDEVVAVMSSSNDIIDLIGIPRVSLASPVSYVVMFKVDDVWFLVACGHTLDGAK
ncbi:unnamed protein product [Lactuca virosa]|uniref:Uncharacterized protein n=1 Tax=Lactuca virosa TaxID=75947 RepID=A0AAU9PNS3_9ASTR|nr:unnamed protein product [Lactuca virosa]